MSQRISRRAFLGTAAASAFLSRCGVKIPPCPVPQPPPMPASCRTGMLFRNWAQTQSCHPAAFCQPHDTGELAALVKAAAAARKTVRVVGAGHSFAPLVLTPDLLVNLDNMQAVVAEPDAEHRVTVQAGIRLKNLIVELRKRGLGLENQGSITEQSIAGVVSTATHGTGLPFGALPTQVEALKLVNGSGDVVTVSGGELRRAARVSLGALGIISEVTLRCVPDRQLELSAYWCHFDQVVERLPALAAENERLRLWWLVWPLGCRQEVVVTTMNTPGAPRGWLGQFEPVRRLGGGPLPMETKPLLKQRPSGAEPPCALVTRFTAPYERVLSFKSMPPFHHECEYAVPVARTAEALRGLRRIFDLREASLLMPVEVRFVKQDDSYLSPTWEGDVCYIGVSVLKNEGPTEIFEPFQALMRSLGGRPHWGKLYSLTAREAEALYPDYGRFQQARREHDPQGVFANDHIRQLFG